MKFNKVELTAIMSMVNAMIMADGKIDDTETSVIFMESLKFGIPLEDIKEIYAKGIEMDAGYSVEIVSKMTYEQKKYVAAYLGTIMAIDGDINDKEMALWRLLSTLCSLPTMNIAEAIKYFSKE